MSALVPVAAQHHWAALLAYLGSNARANVSDNGVNGVLLLRAHRALPVPALVECENVPLVLLPCFAGGEEGSPREAGGVEAVD